MSNRPTKGMAGCVKRIGVADWTTSSALGERNANRGKHCRIKQPERPPPAKLLIQRKLTLDYSLESYPSRADILPPLLAVAHTLRPDPYVSSSTVLPPKQ